MLHMEGIKTERVISDKRADDVTNIKEVVQSAQEVVGQAVKVLSRAEILSQIVFEVTKNPLLLEQYYHLREDGYREDLGLQDFCGEEDHYDREGDIVIGRMGGNVIGGGRINYSAPEKRSLLVLEEGGFTMQTVFPQFDLSGKIYCEFSRLIIKREYRRGGKLLDLLLKKMLLHVQNQGVEFLFTVSPVRQAALYRSVFYKMGLLYVTEPIKVPAKPIYEGIPMVLSRMELTPIVEERIYKKALLVEG